MAYQDASTIDKGPEPEAEPKMPDIGSYIDYMKSLDRKAKADYEDRQVIDYLAKKGYNRTEAMLRAESSNQEVPKESDPRPQTAGAPKYFQAYHRFSGWVEDALEIYKSEVRRLLWPVFVYSYLALVQAFYAKEAQQFCTKFAEALRQEHEYDLRSLERITLPEHTEGDNIAKLYRENKYRLTMSTPTFQYFMQYLESLPPDLYKLLIEIVHNNMDLRQVDRTSDDRHSFETVMLRASLGQDMPDEDEGIPGHRPGNAISSTDPNIGNNLANLRLGRRPMESELEEDIRAEVTALDLTIPPAPGQASLVETHEKLNIKKEEDEEGPSSIEIPFPTATYRDVVIEVNKIRENRDRLKIDSRTGGIGPGVSIVMYTFHNTHDSINCIDFSGDHKLVAAGYAQSFIKVSSMDGAALDSGDDTHSQNSHRLVGHAGPVYAVKFAPSSARTSEDSVDTSTKWLLSCSADGTIRLWSLESWQQLVVYRGHVGPVWDVSWGPYGHYFVSGGMDKTGRIWMAQKVGHLRMLAGHDQDVEKVAWHPNSAYVFTAGYERTVRMWSMNNGTPVRMFTGHTAPITALSCSLDGKLLASADDAGSILIWDLAPGRLKKRMRGHSKAIYTLAWSVESTVLVSGGADCTVRVWDVVGAAKEAAAGKPGDAGKTDGTTAATVGVNLTGAGPKKGRKDAVITADQISAFPTKSTPVYNIQMTNMNLALASGLYLPEQTK
jgi:transcription initiation factor TFIID subunit 5